MNASGLKGHSETDWARVDATGDDEVDTSDSPVLEEAFFGRARVRVPSVETRQETEQQEVTLELDAEVWAWFQAQGDPETLVRAALRLYAEAHKAAR